MYNLYLCLLNLTVCISDRLTYNLDFFLYTVLVLVVGRFDE